MILFRFLLFVLLCTMKMSTASGDPLYRLCYRLKSFYDKKPSKSKPRGWGWQGSSAPETKGKGAKLLQCRLFRQQALLYVTPTHKSGQAFYKFSVGSCLQEQSAEGSNFFPHFFPHLKRLPLLPLLLLGQCKGEPLRAAQIALVSCSLPCLMLPTGAMPAPSNPSRGGARGTHPESWGWR